MMTTDENTHAEGQHGSVDRPVDDSNSPVPSEAIHERHGDVDEGISENEESTTNNVQNGSNDIRTSTTSSENFHVPASAVEPAPTGIQCQLCPRGVYTVFPALFATMAWFACLSKNGCDYARVTGPIVSEITNSEEIPWLEAGFRHYREPKYINMEWVVDPNAPCENWNTDLVEIDGVWMFANITSFLSLVFGGAGAMFVWFASFFTFQRYTWHWAGYEIIVAVILQALTFSWFATTLCKENNCSMHFGARADILSLVLWVVAMLFIFCWFPKQTARSAGAGGSSTEQPPQTEEIEMANQTGGDVPEII